MVAKKKVIKKKTTKKSPVKTGRPSKYEPEFCQKAVEFMALGYSKEAVAGHLKISKDTLYQWSRAHKAFADALKEGVELSRLFWEGAAIKNLITKKDDKKVDASLWIFNMKNRFNWKDKQEIEIGEETRKSFAFDLSQEPKD